MVMCKTSSQTRQYQDAIDRGELTIAKGFELTNVDRARRWVIEQLMCNFQFSKDEFVAQFGDLAPTILNDAEYAAAVDQDGFIVNDHAHFGLTERGKPFVRAIAAKFDAYLGQGTARHSKAV